MIGLCNRCGRSHELDTSALMCSTVTTVHGGRITFAPPCARCVELEATNAALLDEVEAARADNAAEYTRWLKVRDSQVDEIASLQADIAAARAVLDTARHTASSGERGGYLVWVDPAAWLAWQERRR